MRFDIPADGCSQHDTHGVLQILQWLGSGLGLGFSRVKVRVRVRVRARVKVWVRLT